MVLDFDTTVPNANHTPAQDQSTMQTNNLSTSNLINVDHIGFNNASGGQHKQITFNSNNVPIPPTSPPILFTDTVLGLPQLKYFSGDAVHSANQYVVSGNGSTFCLGGIIIKWGSIAGASNNSFQNFPVAFPNACYSVQVTINIGSTVSPVGVNGFNQSGFSFRTTAAGGVPITYIAIGS